MMSLKHLKTLFIGTGQIMLQENAATGVFFLAGIFCGSAVMGLAALLSATIGTYTANLFKYDEEEINSGLYGFSAVLVGVALTCMFQAGITVWLGVLIGSFLAAVIQHFFIVKKIPAFTFPFILVSWVLLFLFSSFPSLGVQAVEGGELTNGNGFTAVFLGYGQVIFQNTIWAGVLFFIGVLICSPVAAIYGLTGAALSALLAYGMHEPVGDIYLGLLSYNAVLCAITFAGRAFQDVLLAFLSIILSVMIVVLMRRLNLPALTFPFVLATWITLILKKVIYGEGANQ
ncbi:urea transporter [Pedobacter sp. HMWF019]|uniref:urea transporter n=1 Tax=Pedobacter sp. HMWF019 TaxID=2056856 RepID=UPI000D39377D|nr:urea transporter [Pedobacter sp. HMWF019]PTS94773.1 urea transporter [Pedobacter sp. HMWF019]